MRTLYCRPVFSFFFFFPCLISVVAEWILPYFYTWCGLSANLGCRSETCCTWLTEKYRTQKWRKKIAIWAPSHNFVGLYLRNLRHMSTIGKKLVKQQYLLHMSSQYGELRPTSGWDHFVILGHPSKFQRLSLLGNITARHSSSGRQPNFAALNKGRHLYSVGWPSRWALAHILVTYTPVTVWLFNS